MGLQSLNLPRARAEAGHRHRRCDCQPKAAPPSGPFHAMNHALSRAPQTHLPLADACLNDLLLLLALLIPSLQGLGTHKLSARQRICHPMHTPISKQPSARPAVAPPWLCSQQPCRRGRMPLGAAAQRPGPGAAQEARQSASRLFKTRGECQVGLCATPATLGPGQAPKPCTPPEENIQCIPSSHSSETY